jgi:hypothetical protein
MLAKTTNRKMCTDSQKIFPHGIMGACVKRKDVRIVHYVKEKECVLRVLWVFAQFEPFCCVKNAQFEQGVIFFD